MKSYLLDSHILIWWLTDDSRLKKKHIEIISNQNLIFFSVASIWELHIKYAKNKLKLPNNFLKEVIKSGFVKLDISLEHAKKTSKLPLIHKDPFDRMLIAQAIVENLKIITVDKMFSEYKDVKIVSI